MNFAQDIPKPTKIHVVTVKFRHFKIPRCESGKFDLVSEQEKKQLNDSLVLNKFESERINGERLTGDCGNRQNKWADIYVRRWYEKREQQQRPINRSIHRGGNRISERRGEKEDKFGFSDTCS